MGGGEHETGDGKTFSQNAQGKGPWKSNGSTIHVPPSPPPPLHVDLQIYKEAIPVYIPHMFGIYFPFEVIDFLPS